MVTGPTASGKTRLAVQLAHALNGEIISADSRQVYTHMNIGTGKDLDEYMVDGKQIPVHLVDITGPGTRFHIFAYINAFYKAFEDITARGKLPVICGGTGLYLDVLLKQNSLVAVPVNDDLRARLVTKSKPGLEALLRQYPGHEKYAFDYTSAKRLVRAIEIMDYLQQHPAPPAAFHDLRPLIIGTQVDVETRRARISQRLHQRLANGMIEEVEGLLAMGIPHAQLEYFGLEYKFISQYLQGKLSHADMTARLETGIHQYAKRQMTWFRKMEKEGVDIHWVDADNVAGTLDWVKNRL